MTGAELKTYVQKGREYDPDARDIEGPDQHGCIWNDWIRFRNGQVNYLPKVAGDTAPKGACVGPMAPAGYINRKHIFEGYGVRIMGSDFSLVLMSGPGKTLFKDKEHGFTKCLKRVNTLYRLMNQKDVRKYRSALAYWNVPSPSKVARGDGHVPSQTANRPQSLQSSSRGSSLRGIC